jgi:hypothetical protein
MAGLLRDQRGKTVACSGKAVQHFKLRGTAFQAELNWVRIGSSFGKRDAKIMFGKQAS